MKELDISYIAGLVVQARQNDSDAFAELYALTYNKVYNYARHYLRDDYLAQDAMQEVYILALKNLSKLNDPTLFIAWLNRISFHVCFDLSKRLKNGNTELTGTELLEIVEDRNIHADPEAACQHKDEYRRLNESLDQLPFLEKQVIIMRYFNNMKLEEIASACTISRSSVKQYLASGQAALKSLMKG